MIFDTDTQTLHDLNLTGKYNPGSVFYLFNAVKTSGGEQLLESMFRNPLTDAAQVNSRVALFRFFGSMEMEFPFNREALTIMENYLAGAGQGRMASYTRPLRKYLQQCSGIGNDYKELEKAVAATIQILHELHRFLSRLDMPISEDAFTGFSEVRKFLSRTAVKQVLRKAGNGSLSVAVVMRSNYLFQHSRFQDLQRVLMLIYSLDVFLSVSGIARGRGFCYPEAILANETSIEIEGCRHPCIQHAVGNSVRFSRDENLVFLTGANMAGKSTFMKSVAIAVYLAHMGFPVAARSMKFTIMDGIYTSINVPDNLQAGYSHYYAEVQRVKTVAARVSDGRKLLVIFDELFKGTNVKDAYDATFAITGAFGEYRNCAFIISTHIIEVAAALQETLPGIQFVYLPTLMKDGRPEYTYKLRYGVTSDRHGMMIIENEGLIDILRGVGTIKNVGI